PPVRSTKELVHRFLLIGNTQPHTEPAIATMAPAARSPAMRSCSGRGADTQRPAMSPRMAVATAGMVDRTPSGSQLIVWAQMWLPQPEALQSSSARSTHAASVEAG